MSHLSRIQSGLALLAALFVMNGAPALQGTDADRFKTPSFLLSRGERAGYLHCHSRSTTTPTAAYPDSYRDWVREHLRPIVSARGSFAKCPTWILGARSGETDDADINDVALTPRLTQEITATRRRLILELERLSGQSPQGG